MKALREALCVVAVAMLASQLVAGCSDDDAGDSVGFGGSAGAAGSFGGTGATGGGAGAPGTDGGA
ncbi:MAG TPA: hypothetical protein VKY73_04970, partial [Polyangiaceae bacterium]|nr:hypothetical protein [Polyangiaceae bacterium]